MILPSENPQKLAKVLFVFFSQFKDIKFDNKFMKDFGFDKMMKIDFTNEHPDLMLP